MAERNRGWLDEDQASWRGFCAKKPPWFYLQRVLGNLLDDETATGLQVSINPHSKNIVIDIHCACSGDFPDPYNPWTLFASGRRDSHNLRGRRGKGLKEFVALMDDVQLRAGSSRVRLTARKEEPLTISRGIKTAGVDINATTSLWKLSAIPEMVERLRLINPPKRVVLDVNGIEVARRASVCSCEMLLQTIRYDERGTAWMPLESATASLLTPGRGEPSLLYEMGMPVQLIPGEHHININQRIPLVKKTGMAPKDWLKGLRAATIYQRVQELERCQPPSTGP